MRRKFIAGNWKLNLGPTESAELGLALRQSLSTYLSVDLAVFPSALSVGAVIPVLSGTGIEPLFAIWGTPDDTAPIPFFITAANRSPNSI